MPDASVPFCDCIYVFKRTPLDTCIRSLQEASWLLDNSKFFASSMINLCWVFNGAPQEAGDGNLKLSHLRLTFHVSRLTPHDTNGPGRNVNLHQKVELGYIDGR